MNNYARVYIFVEMEDPHDPFTLGICGDHARVSLGSEEVRVDFYNTVDKLFDQPYLIGCLEDEKALLNLLLLRDAKRRLKNG